MIKFKNWFTQIKNFDIGLGVKPLNYDLTKRPCHKKQD